MKLFETYSKIIARLGKIEVAWFTTFNLDPELLERFLLPVLVDKPSSELKTAEDYEALNLDLNEIDIKVWYDFRALNLRSQKRTTVELISINPSEKYKYLSDKSIFHPKVIFLKGEKGAYVICGSANLSVAAWSSNRESIIAKQIVSRDNAKQVVNFFNSIGAETSKLQPWISKLSVSDSHWNFVCTAENRTFIDEFQFGKGTLCVWSPYFSCDMFVLLNELRKKGVKDIFLVPDFSASKIRINQEQLEQLKGNDKVKLMVDSTNSDSQRFCHAKVWFTDNNLAIGSWNFTMPATGVGILKKDKNIEAGIITSIGEKEVQVLKTSLKPFATTPPGISLEEMEAEWKEVLNPFLWNGTITADWEKFIYSTSENSILPEHYVILPDNPQMKILLSEVNQKSYLENFRRVLKNKTFQVYNKKNELVYEGYLNEINCRKRPVYGYLNLEDALISLIENPSGETTRKRVVYNIDPDNDDNPRDIFSENIEKNSTVAYYTMFVAIQKLYEKIESISRADADKIGYRNPGSLSNLKELVKESIANCIKNEEDEILYNWFLSNELNRCIEAYSHFTSGMPDVNPISLVDTKILISKLYPDIQDKKFMDQITKSFYNGVF